MGIQGRRKRVMTESEEVCYGTNLYIVIDVEPQIDQKPEEGGIRYGKRWTLLPDADRQCVCVWIGSDPIRSVGWRPLVVERQAAFLSYFILLSLCG